MPTKKKMDLVEELREKFTQCTIAVATDFSGLPASTMSELRQRMREKDIEYRVVKNTLTYLAADSADRPEIKEIVQGPTAIAFGYSDPVTVAKALEEYIRVNRSSLTIRGAAMDRRALTPAQVVALSNLPPRQELVGQLLGQLLSPMSAFLGQLQAPMRGLINTLNGPVAALTILLQQRVDQLESQQEPG